MLPQFSVINFCCLFPPLFCCLYWCIFLPLFLLPVFLSLQLLMYCWLLHFLFLLYFNSCCNFYSRCNFDSCCIAIAIFLCLFALLCIFSNLLIALFLCFSVIIYYCCLDLFSKEVWYLRKVTNTVAIKPPKLWCGWFAIFEVQFYEFCKVMAVLQAEVVLWQNNNTDPTKTNELKR